MKKKWLWIIGILIVIVAAVAVYFTWFFAYSCDDMVCFKSHQEKCVPTKFLYDSEDVTWFYRIRGESEGKCEIDATVVNVKAGTLDKEKLNGKSMKCFLRLGGLNLPESEIEKCHGVLKEEMQNIIIQKLHSYVIENIGQISSEMTSSAP